MNWTSFFAGTLLAISTLDGQCQTGSDHYEVFLNAWHELSVEKLDLIGSEAIGLGETPDDIQLLSKACLAFLRSEHQLSIGLLDSLDGLLLGHETLVQSWTHRMKAKIFKQVRDLPKAKVEIGKALTLLGNSEFQPEYSSCLIIRAEILRKMYDHEGALRSLEEARIIAEELEYGPSICNGLINRGNIYYDQNRFEEAWSIYKETVDQSLHFHFDNIAANAVMNLGAVAYMMKGYDRAEHLYDSIYHTLGNGHEQFKADLLRHSASARSKLGKDQEALEFYGQALSAHQQLGDSSGIAKTFELRSTLLWKLGRSNDAIKELKKAIEIARSKKWSTLESSALSKLHRWYKELGRNEEALDALGKHVVLADSIAESRFHSDLANAEVRFDTERKERDLQLHKAILAEERAVRQRRSTQRNLLLGLLAAALFVGFIGYRNIKHRQSLALKEKELSEQKVEDILRSQELRLVNAMMEGQEKERVRVSKDLHDRLGSMLSSIKLQFSTLESRIKELKSDQQSTYQKVLSMLDNAVGEVRRISHDMVSGALAQFGLAAALTDLRESISVEGKLDVELKLFGLERRMDRTLEITAYRIVQELVSNALKHAAASELSIALTRSADELSIVVTDNGKGFDPQQPKEGMGLNNVQQRAAMVGGTIHVDSTHGLGSTVSVTLPLRSV